MTTTMISISQRNLNTNLKVARAALKAMSRVQDLDNGTIRNPYELASSILEDGRTLIETIYEDGCVVYNDGFYVVEVDDEMIYVDLTGIAMRDMGLETVECLSDYEFPEEDC